MHRCPTLQRELPGWREGIKAAGHSAAASPHRSFLWFYDLCWLKGAIRTPPPAALCPGSPCQQLPQVRASALSNQSPLISPALCIPTGVHLHSRGRFQGGKRKSVLYTPNVKAAPAPLVVFCTPRGLAASQEDRTKGERGPCVTSSAVTESACRLSPTLSLSSTLLISLASCPLPFSPQTAACLAGGILGGQRQEGPWARPRAPTTSADLAQAWEELSKHLSFFPSNIGEKCQG